MLTLEDFESDMSWSPDTDQKPQKLETQIDGVEAKVLIRRQDHRGNLCECLTTRDGDIAPIVHVYAVTAAPKSVRAWVYHKYQWDRLVYTQGQFRVVLYDIRDNSPTYGKLDVLEVGLMMPTLLLIPPFVVHGVENYGERDETFINMPTNVYYPGKPDKFRLAKDHPGIPYTFGRS